MSLLFEGIRCKILLRSSGRRISANSGTFTWNSFDWIRNRYLRDMMFQKWNVQRLSSTHSGLFLQFFCGFPEQLETLTSVVKESDFVVVAIVGPKTMSIRRLAVDGWMS